MKNFWFLLILILVVSCGGAGESSDSSSSSSGITISGTISESAGVSEATSSYLSPIALEDLEIYCVAFNAAADSCSDQLDSSGNFSCSGIPANASFGCFIKGEQGVVASLEIAGTGSGFNSTTSSSIALGGDTNFGNVVLNTATGKATVDRSQIVESISSTSSVISVDDIHNTTWALSCVNGPDSLMNIACSEFVTQSPSVFFRLLKATKNSDSSTVYGIGVWASQSSFNNCGATVGVDMTTTMKEAIEDEDSITFSQNSVGIFSTDNGSSGACPSEDNGSGGNLDPNSDEPTVIDSYYALNKLTVNGNDFSIIEDEDEYVDNGCTFNHSTAVTFSPSSASEMFGSFTIVDAESGSNCPGEGGVFKFTVKFTKQ